MPYSLEQYVDLITVTLRELERNEWTDIVTDLQVHIAMPMVLKKHRVEFGSGFGYQFNARVGSNSPASNVQLNQQDNPTTADMFVVGTGNYRISQTYWAINEIEIDANRNPARLVSLLKGKRIDAMQDLAELMETNFWSAPTSSTDVVNPRGLPYWLSRNTTQGFNGGAPSGFTDVAGISPTTYPRWSNYTDQYLNVTKTDFVRKTRRAMTFTNFRPPVPYPSSTGQSYEKTGLEPNRFGLYTNYAVVQKCEELLESQTDDITDDIAKMDGTCMIRKSPLVWVPKLETDTQNPIYGVDWKSMFVYFMEGNYMHETEVRPIPYIHRALAQYTDCVYDFVCKNRRQNFRITL